MSMPTSTPAATSARPGCCTIASPRSSTSRPAASSSTPPAARTASASSTSPSSTTRASPNGSSTAPPCPRSANGSSSAPGTPARHRFKAPDDGIAPDPTRNQNRDENREAKIHAIYGYLYVADSEEGLITIPAGTIIDGNPLNNFLGRDVTFNPGNILAGARSINIVGTSAYICCDAGLVVVDLDDPKHPRVTSIIGPELLHHPRSAQVQFRYCYVCDDEGVKVLDVTDLAHPRPVSMLPLADAHSIYLARTYAYVAAGPQGLVILDIENAAQPRIDQVFNAGGCINDVHDVKLGITYTSEFAYLADGVNGLRVVQLTNPETPGNMGFSPAPPPS